MPTIGVRWCFNTTERLTTASYEVMTMATAHSTSKGPSGHNHPTTRARKGRPPPHPDAPPLDREAFRDGLTKHARTVRDAMFVAMTCGDAMRHQNADGEEEVATVLGLYCSNQLYRALQETGMLLALLDGKTNVDPESEEVTSLADP
jgi:hypothetical protein